MKRRLRVTVMMDDTCIVDDPPHFTEYRREHSTEYNVVNSLRRLGHEVAVLGVANLVEPIVDSLSRDRPDVVFNLSEQFREQRRFDRNVAALLELLDLPFTGTGSIGLTLCRNKGLCKQLLSARRIRVPRFIVVRPGRRARPPKALRFPLVVKPLYEDGSDGISNASLVGNAEELGERSCWIHERFGQPAIAEEYIDGREIYVGLLGNSRLTALPPRELYFGKSEDGPKLATYHAKWNEAYQKKWGLMFRTPRLAPEVTKRIARICKKAFRLLQIHDYGRIDLRLTPDNQIYVLEANPNPGLDSDDEMALAAEKAGIHYIPLIDRIVRLALRRHGVRG